MRFSVRGSKGSEATLLWDQRVDRSKARCSADEQAVACKAFEYGADLFRDTTAGDIFFGNDDLQPGEL